MCLLLPFSLFPNRTSNEEQRWKAPIKKRILKRKKKKGKRIAKESEAPLFRVVSVWPACFHTSIELTYAGASANSMPNLCKTKILFNRMKLPADPLIRFFTSFPAFQRIRFRRFCLRDTNLFEAYTRVCAEQGVCRRNCWKTESGAKFY